MERVTINLATVIPTEGTINMENQMGLVFILGLMELCTKVSSRMALSKERVNGKNHLKSLVAQLMNMSETMLVIKNVVRVNSNGHLAITTRVSTWTMNEMAMVKCNGLMAVNTLVSGSKVSSMATEKLSFLMEHSRKGISIIMPILDIYRART